MASGETSKPGGGAKAYHCLYDTIVQCTSVPAKLRVYSPFNDLLLADDSMAYVIARAYIPLSIPRDPILLEASEFAAFPGDPGSEEYEAAIPDCPWPVIFGVGTVTMRAVSLPDGVTKAFAVTSSDFVRDANMSSTVVCCFDSSRPRWCRTPVPNLNTAVFYTGQFSGAAASGWISVDLRNISLNVGVHDQYAAGGGSSGAKKRKFVSKPPMDACGGGVNRFGKSSATPPCIPSFGRCYLLNVVFKCRCWLRAIGGVLCVCSFQSRHLRSACR